MRKGKLYFFSEIKLVIKYLNIFFLKGVKQEKTYEHSKSIIIQKSLQYEKVLKLHIYIQKADRLFTQLNYFI